jgi:hypothetical protein
MFQYRSYNFIYNHLPEDESTGSRYVEDNKIKGSLVGIYSTY